MKRILQAVLFVLLSTAAFAWPSCSGNWVQVPTGTKGGTIYVTSDGLTFQCQTTPPSTPSTGSNSNSNSNTNSNSNSNNNSSRSSSSSGSAAISGSVASGGNSSSTANGGNSTSSATNSLTNSGNSRSSSTATGGAGGAGGNSYAGGGTSNQTQNQTSTSEATGNGNGSNNTSDVTNVAAAKIPVATAYAPAQWPTVSCFKPYGGGAQSAPAGISIGLGKIDPNCAIIEGAVRAKNLLTFCKVYITNKYVKKAGVTLADCMAQDQTPVQAPPKPVTVDAIPVAPPAPPAPVAVVPVPTPEPQPIASYHWICTFAGKGMCNVNGTLVSPARPTSICKEMILSVVQALNDYQHAIVIVRGNANSEEDQKLRYTRAENVRSALLEAGISADRIQVEPGNSGLRTVELSLESR